MANDASSLEELRTPRLIAERAQPEHLKHLCAIFQDERVTATLGGRRSVDQVQAMLDAYISHWDEHGFGMWMFRDAATGKFVGRGGLRRVNVVGEEDVELAYALVEESWGRGLATEMAEACAEVAFGQLKLTDLVAFTLHDNTASRRVMEKVGFVYERDITHADLPHVLYRLAAPRGVAK